MKKLLTLALAATMSLTIGCTKHTRVQSVHYTAYGRYYTNGTVITNDGNEWKYSTDIISDKTPYDSMPIWISFDDNATPNDIEDDIILGVVYDRNTAIYDELEDALGDKFELERDGNYIHVVESTESGTLFTFADGTGYYVEN